MLLKATSRPPSSRTTVATIASTSSSWRQSATTGMARPPSASISATTERALSARMSLTATAAPARAIQRAIWRPMPAPAPVTSTALPW